MEPNHLPVSVDDLGARRVAASRRGDEDVPVGLAGVAGQHGERRRRCAGGPDGARGGGAAPAGGQGEDEANGSGDNEQQPPAEPRNCPLATETAPQQVGAPVTKQPGGEGSVDCFAAERCLLLRYFNRNVPYKAGTFLSPLLFTQDGGRTWAVPRLPAGQVSIGTVSCPGDANCIAVGPVQRGGSETAFALVTDDGGRDWGRINVPKGVNELSRVACGSPRSCIVVGFMPTGRTITAFGVKEPTNRTVASRTSDADRTWLPVGLPKASVVYQIACTGPICTFTDGMGPNGATGPSSFVSDNGGSTWAPSALDDAPAWRLFGLTCSPERI